jgi:hypothetical protein
VMLYTLLKPPSTWAGISTNSPKLPKKENQTVSIHFSHMYKLLFTGRA